MEWKWSIGEHYEKSGRKSKPYQKIDDTVTVGEIKPNSAQNQSLLSENDVWSLETPMPNFMKANKREETYNKMSEREMMCQVGQNPFMANHNYLEDITAHEQFMKPKNTFVEKEQSSSLSMN